jgi:hypothetical protein
MKRAILALALLATPTSAAQTEDKTFYALQSCLSFGALDEIPGMLSPDLIRRRLEARCAREIGDSRRSGDDPSQFVQFHVVTYQEAYNKLWAKGCQP